MNLEENLEYSRISSPKALFSENQTINFFRTVFGKRSSFCKGYQNAVIYFAFWLRKHFVVSWILLAADPNRFQTNCKWRIPITNSFTANKKQIKESGLRKQFVFLLMATRSFYEMHISMLFTQQLHFLLHFSAECPTQLIVSMITLDYTVFSSFTRPLMENWITCSSKPNFAKTCESNQFSHQNQQYSEDFISFRPTEVIKVVEYSSIDRKLMEKTLIFVTLEHS